MGRDRIKQEYKCRALILEQKSLAHLEIDWEIKYWELAGHLDKFSSFLNFAFFSFLFSSL